MASAFDTDRPAVPHVALGMALRLASAIALAAMFAGVKWAGQQGVSVGESLFYRQIGTALCAVVWVAMGPGFASLKTKRVGAHVARMAIGVIAMGLNFLTFVLLPLAEATAIGFSVPIFATLLAALVLGERTGWWRWSAVLAGFLGVLVIVQPGSGHIEVHGGAVAVAAALSTAGATIAIRRLKGSIDGTHYLERDEANGLKRLQREQDPKSPFVFTCERGATFTTAGFARMVERAGRRRASASRLTRIC